MYLWIVGGIHSGDRCEADHGCMQVSIDFLAVMSTSPRGRLDAFALKMQLPCCCMQDNSTKEMGVRLSKIWEPVIINHFS